MRDRMIDADMYTEEAFEAFESDGDSMLILGQPIDDQIKIKNIASFAIPKKKTEEKGDDDYGQGVVSGDEYEECEYEDSFESPGKSLTEQNLREFSSITFGQSKMDHGGDTGANQNNSIQVNKPEKVIKRRKKKKRVTPAAAVAKTVQIRDGPTETSVPAQYQHVNTSNSGGQNLQPISRSGDRNRNGSAMSGSRNSAHTHLTHRVNTAGRTVSGTSSAGGYRQQSQQSQQGHQQHQQIYRPHQEYSSSSNQHDSSQPSPRQQQQGTTPPIYPTHGAGPGSVVSHTPSNARAHHAPGAVFTSGMLQRQLDTALKQVAMYRRENEALQQNLDSAGINEAVERYKALLIEKQHQIIQLESENNGLKSVARYQGKYLAEKARDSGGVDSIQSHEKKIEVMLIHTRKMKEKVKKLEAREEELVVENEHLHTQNGRLQRKNTKLKKQVAAAEQFIKKNANNNNLRVGPVSISILDILNGHNIDTAGSDTVGGYGGGGGGAMKTDSAEDVDFTAFGSHGGISTEPSVALEHHTNSSPHPQQQGSVTSGESAGPDGVASNFHSSFHSGTATNAAHSHSYSHGHGHQPLAAMLPTSKTAVTAKNAKLRRRLEEQEEQIRKQQGAIEALEKSLQAQRGRFQREIDVYKAQAEQAAEEVKKLEVELDKRERFGRNQVCNQTNRIAYAVHLPMGTSLVNCSCCVIFYARCCYPCTLF